MDTVLVIMQKDYKTGLFEKELTSLNINQNDEYILNIYAMKDENENLNIHLKLTTKEDVSDWEFNAIYDYYDKSIFEQFSLNVTEKDEEYNPTWEIIIKNEASNEKLEKTINILLNLHKNELDEVFSIIKDKKGEYKYGE